MHSSVHTVSDNNASVHGQSANAAITSSRRIVGAIVGCRVMNESFVGEAVGGLVGARVTPGAFPSTATTLDG